MGLMDKMKKILFDEEDIEVPITSEELPERKPKKVEEPQKKEVKSSTGFIDYHHEEESEDTIKEIIVPKEEVKEEKKETLEPTPRLRFPVDDFDLPEEKMPTRSSRGSSRDLLEPSEPKSVKRDYDELSRYFDKPSKKEPIREEPIFKKTKTSDSMENGKKPFQVTPIISPVFGILDKNYKPEEIANKREVINKVNNGIKKDRQYGPVSYNDEPLPKPHTYAYKEEKPLKEELVELNTTISELINDSVTNEEIKEEIEYPKDKVRIPEPIEEEDPIIATENYDEIEESIESAYAGNNTIEDAFEATSEFDEIRQKDDTLQTLDEIPDDEHLDETIETDLFNLIDSMYKSDDNEESEGDED